MVEYYIDIEDVIADFLRVYMIDPKNRAESTDNNSFNSTTGQTDFIIKPPSGSVSCVTSVIVNRDSKTKWKDYFWDYQNSKIIFYEGLVLDDEVIINFKYGSSNWIYSDKPDEKLRENSFPRISLFTIGGGGNKIGNYKAPIDSRPVVQIDCWTRVDQVFTIDSKKYSNEYLGRYLGNHIINSFNDFEESLFGVFFDFDVVGYPRTAPYSEEYNSYHTVVEIRLKGLNLGRIIK